MTTQRSKDINCILKLAQQKAASHRSDTPIHLRQQRVIFSTVTHLRHALQKGQLRIPYACAAFVRSFTAISCAVFACSIAVTNPFYLSALTRKQMSKRLPTAEARDASRAQGCVAGPKDTGRC